MNIVTARTLLDCGHAPAPHPYWRGNAHEAGGRLICLRCSDLATEAVRRRTVLSCGHTATPSDHPCTEGAYCLSTSGVVLQKVCHECAASEWLREMERTGRFYCSLHRTREILPTASGGEVPAGRWCIELTSAFRLGAQITEGSHNIARVRRDCWFLLAGEQWHGVQIGNNTGGATCKRTKNRHPDRYSYDDYVAALTETARRRTERDRAADLLGIAPMLPGWWTRRGRAGDGSG